MAEGIRFRGLNEMENRLDKLDVKFDELKQLIMRMHSSKKGNDIATRGEITHQDEEVNIGSNCKSEVSNSTNEGIFPPFNYAFTQAPQMFDKSPVMNFYTTHTPGNYTSPYTLSVQTTLSTGQFYYALEPITVCEDANSFGTPDSESLNIRYETEVAEINMKIAGEAGEVHSRTETDTKIAYKVEAINEIGNEIELKSETDKSLEVVTEENVLMKYVSRDPVKEDNEVKKSSEKKANKQKSKAQPSDQANEVTSDIVINLNSQTTFLLVDSSHGMPFRKTLGSQSDLVTTRSLLKDMKFDPSHDWGDAEPAKMKSACVPTARPWRPAQQLTYKSVALFYVDDHPIDEARIFLEEKQIARHVVALQTFLAGCMINQCINVRKRAIEQLCELEPLNAENYVTLSTLYAYARNLESLMEIQQDIVTSFEVISTLRNVLKTSSLWRNHVQTYTQHIGNCIDENFDAIYTHNDFVEGLKQLFKFDPMGVCTIEGFGEHIFVDVVAALSIEALRADIGLSFISLLIDSGDGSSDKDEVGVASDLKVFLNGSKLLGKNQVNGYSVNDLDIIPEVHGLFRIISRILHAKSRVFSNSWTAGSGIVVILTPLAKALLNLGESSWRRANLIVGSLGINEATPYISQLVEMFRSQCPGNDRLNEVYNCAKGADSGGDNLKFAHDIYVLSDLVRTILSWEAIAAFISISLISGTDIFIPKSNVPEVEATNYAGADNGKAIDKKHQKEISLLEGRFQSCLRELRSRACDFKDDSRGIKITKVDWGNLNLHIASYNNFPTAASLASSAVGLACFVFALANLMHLKEDHSQLSAIARQGSGSARRSLFGGFVKWIMGKEENRSDSIAVQLADENHWDDLDLVIVIVVVSARQKETSSTSGMHDSCKTSMLIQHRAREVVSKRVIQMEEAIGKHDFSSFARLACADSNQFLAVCLDTSPPIFYMNDTFHRITSCVEKWNHFEGTSQLVT